MRIHIIQPSLGTPPGNILEWLDTKGLAPILCQPFAGDRLPATTEFDWLVILGGPMNVDESTAHPWLIDLKRLLKDDVAENKSCLGLCLGGQLLAQTLGARVQRNSLWEIGWLPVRLADGRDLPVFHFHCDKFDLPPNAVRLASTAITENQAFSWGDRIVATQFHPEATESWVRECADEDEVSLADNNHGHSLSRNHEDNHAHDRDHNLDHVHVHVHVQNREPYIQDRQTILANMQNLEPMKEWFFQLLDRLEAVTRQSL